MEGTYFRSNERMTNYTITNSKGSFVKGGMGENEGDSILAAPDTVKARKKIAYNAVCKENAIKTIHKQSKQTMTTTFYRKNNCFCFLFCNFVR